MKKITCMIMVLMLMISILSFASAEEAEEPETPGLGESQEADQNESEEPENNETEEEIIAMTYSHGSEIRLLQLEKAITKNLLKGEMAVEVLKGLSYNTSDLEAILSEMHLVLDEAKAADPNASDAVEVFVDLKSDAKNLTKQFRETIKDLLSEVKYKEIREQIKNMTNDIIQNYSKKIQNRIKQFNRNQVHRLYGIIGEGNNSYVNQYMNGSMSLMQLKMQISKMVNQKTKEKMQIYKGIKGEKIKFQNKANETFENVTKNFEERHQQRLQNRLEWANNTGNEKLMEKIQNKIDNGKGGPGNAGGNGSHGGNGNGNGKGKK